MLHYVIRPYFLRALGVLHRFATEIKPLKLDLDNTSGRNEIMHKYFFILLLFQKTILALNVLTGVVVNIQNQTPIEGVNITCGEEGTTSNSEGKFEIKPGDRIAQMIIVPILQAEFEIVDEFKVSSRGVKGFGSSGIN